MGAQIEHIWEKFNMKGTENFFLAHLPQDQIGFLTKLQNQNTSLLLLEGLRV